MSPTVSPPVTRPEHSSFRWTVCALLFFATTISYVDRQVLSLLAKTLEVHIGWTASEYGSITSAFAVAYAIGLLGAGRLLDKFGTRVAFAIAVAVWSAAAMMHAAATTALTFGIARVFLGFGEAANFPACIKTVAEWFPKRQRATATGIFNSGANIGAVATIILVPWMADIRLAIHLSGHWRHRLYLGGLVAVDLQTARGASQGVGGRAGADSQRSGGQGGIRTLAPLIGEKRNLGVRAWASSSPTPSGGFSFSGCPCIFRTPFICR